MCNAGWQSLLASYAGRPSAVRLSSSVAHPTSRMLISPRFCTAVDFVNGVTDMDLGVTVPFFFLTTVSISDLHRLAHRTGKVFESSKISLINTDDQDIVALNTPYPANVPPNRLFGRNAFLATAVHK